MSLSIGCSCSKLRKLSRKITMIYDHHLAPDELTVGQYSLLARIGKLGPIGVIPLAQYMGLDRSTMSRTLKPLISLGWIQTLDLPIEELTDKRSFGVSLTASGIAKWQSAKPNWQNAQQEIDHILGHETHQDLMHLIDDANAKFDLL
ncbi:MarR family winged helix-turn-helix transcriptional regulator [Aquirhabdus sp.]|uniref:MarR family winged helix-turn-helix transcriptional regulator n=1 Tax=Aquirhabdus sp. TaxID=2824160 RepID=UPI00396C88A8